MNTIVLASVVCTNMGRDANNCGGTSAYNADENRAGAVSDRRSQWVSRSYLDAEQSRIET